MKGEREPPLAFLFSALLLFVQRINAINRLELADGRSGGSAALDQHAPDDRQSPLEVLVLQADFDVAAGDHFAALFIFRERGAPSTGAALNAGRRECLEQRILEA